MYSFVPKRPVKSFQDLEVYQKLENVAVLVVKRLLPETAGQNEKVKAIAEELFNYLLKIPKLIAAAHSRRFGTQTEAIGKLEEAMLLCNLSVVCLEQYRDLRRVPAPKLPDVKPASLPKAAATIAAAGLADVAAIDSFFFDEQIKTLLSCRSKLLHLQMSWQKFAKQNSNS